MRTMTRIVLFFVLLLLNLKTNIAIAGFTVEDSPYNSYWEQDDDEVDVDSRAPLSESDTPASAASVSVFNTRRVLSLNSHSPISKSTSPNLNRFSTRAASSQTTGTIDLSKQNDTSNLNTPPPTENGEPIRVDMSVLILQVRDIKELTEEITLEFNLRMYWKDPRLKYLVHEDGQDKKFVAVSLKLLDKLWYPDIYLDHVKSVAQPSLITRPASLRVYSDSTVRYSARFTIVMSCPMDFHMYPADTQKCGVGIKSYAFTNKILDLKWHERGAFLVDKLELPNFDVGLDRPENFSIATTSGAYAGVRFKVVLRRKLSYHLLQTYFPSMLFVTISWLSFLVQPESVPARMTLSMTTLLTLTSMFSSIRSGIPSVSYIKALDIWMVWCVLFVHFTLIEYAIVLKINSMKRVPKPEPPPVQQPSSPTPAAVSVPNARSQFKANILRSSIEDSPPLVPAIYNPKQDEGEAHAAQIGQGYGGGGGGASPDSSYEVLNLSGKCLQFRHRIFRSNSTSPLLPGAAANGYSHAKTCTSEVQPPTTAQLQPQDPTSYKPLVVKIERYTSAIIPSMFLVFNLIYWPWLLQALDASEDETVYYHI